MLYRLKTNSNTGTLPDTR